MSLSTLLSLMNLYKSPATYLNWLRLQLKCFKCLNFVKPIGSSTILLALMSIEAIWEAEPTYWLLSKHSGTSSNSFSEISILSKFGQTAFSSSPNFFSLLAARLISFNLGKVINPLAIFYNLLWFSLKICKVSKPLIASSSITAIELWLKSTYLSF